MSALGQRMATGIAWMIGARLMDRAIGMVSTLLLARLLEPSDFGLVAMATAIGGILDLLGSFSFDLALIQKKNADRSHYDTVWTFNLIFGIICTVSLLVLAKPASLFYHEPRLVSVMYVLAVMYALSSFNNVGVVNFRKELLFRQEFIFIFARRVITFGITVTAAYLLRSYWALLMGMVIGRAVSVWMSYQMNAYRPRWSLAAAGELFHFSKWMLVNNALGFLRHDGCTFIIGRIFGSAGLGVYSVSYEISNLPSTELVAPINRVTFPGYAQMNDPKQIASSYLRLLGMIALLILPVGIGIAAVAEPLVRTMLGEKWLMSVPLVAILAISGAINATQTNNSSVWLAMGHPRKVTVVQACYLAVLFPSLYFFVTKFGVVGTGYAYLTAQTVDVVMEMSTTKRLLNLQWRAVASVVWRPIAGVVGMYFVVGWVDGVVAQSAPLPLLRLMIDAGAGAAFYCGAVVALWWIDARPNSAEAFCLRRLRLLPQEAPQPHQA